jgi:hypothetical protein
MRFFLIILFIILTSCSHRKDSRRSDFVTGCFFGTYQILNNLSVKVDSDSLVDFCIIHYDNTPEIEKKLDELNKYIPQRRIKLKNRYEDYLINPKEEKTEDSSFQYI